MGMCWDLLKPALTGLALMLSIVIGALALLSPKPAASQLADSMLVSVPRSDPSAMIPKVMPRAYVSPSKRARPRKTKTKPKPAQSPTATPKPVSTPIKTYVPLPKPSPTYVSPTPSATTQTLSPTPTPTPTVTTPVATPGATAV